MISLSTPLIPNRGPRNSRPPPSALKSVWSNNWTFISPAEHPTQEKKAAVDLELGGVPESVWEGGPAGKEADTWSSSGGNQRAESQRHLLLPVLHAIQNRIGWISHGAMNHVALRLDVPPAEVYG